MNLKKLIRETARRAAREGNVTAPVNKAVVDNTGEGQSVSGVSSRQRIVQRDGETEVYEQRVEYSDG